MGLFGTSHYLRGRLVYLNTFQISSQSESVSILLIHLCLLHRKHFQSRFMEADGFSVASHAGAFGELVFLTMKNELPLKRLCGRLASLTLEGSSWKMKLQWAILPTF